MKKITTMPNVTYEYELGSTEVKKESIKGNIPIGPKEYDKLKFIKISSTSDVTVGEVFDYTFIIINGYKTVVEKLLITDKVDKNIKFIDNSIKVDNKIKKDENIVKGIKISRLEPNEMKQISFKVKLINNPELGKIISQGRCTYSFSNQDVTARESIDSNLVITNTTNYNVYINLQANSKSINRNKKVVFNATITNTGILDIKNLNLFFNIPKQAKLNTSKVQVNSKIVHKVDLTKGLILEDLKPGNTHNIEYEIKLINDDISTLTSGLYANYNLDTQYDKITSSICRIDSKVEKIITINSYINENIYIYEFRNYHNIEEITSDISIQNYKLFHNIKYNQAILDGWIRYKIIYYDLESNKHRCISKKDRFNLKVMLPNDYKYDDIKIIKIDTNDLCYKFVNNKNMKVYGNLSIDFMII